jgi:asparagine N-glycosylation enzyme membrane subunit Stt3
MNIIFGLFLIAHGLIHGLYFIKNPPADPSFPFIFNRSWLYKKFGPKTAYLGKLLSILALTLFSVSGIFLMGFTGLNYLWLSFALSAAILSAFLFILFWHKWLIIGFIINLIIIYSTLRIILS